MIKLSVIMCCYILITPSTWAQNSPNKKIVPSKATLITSDKFKLIADYYAGDTLKGGVLLLHDCNADRRSYKNLAIKLAMSGLHVLNLDFRGYGESTTDNVSQLLIRKKAKNILAYKTAMTSLTSFWKDDSSLALQWLRNKVNNSKQIAIVSVGCSVNYAINAAEKMHINSFVLITPKMDYSDKERYKNMPDAPSYFVSSSHQLESYKTAQELYQWNGDHKTKLQLFKDKRNGHALLNYQIGLAEDITHWLTRNLK